MPTGAHVVLVRRPSPEAQLSSKPQSPWSTGSSCVTSGPGLSGPQREFTDESLDTDSPTLHPIHSSSRGPRSGAVEVGQLTYAVSGGRELSVGGKGGR